MTTTDIDVAELYHENSKITLFENGDSPGSLPPPLAPGISLERIPLSRCTGPGAMPLEEAIIRRASTRAFNGGVALAFDMLSRLLAFSCGFTAAAGAEGGGAFEFHRAAPSAGATFPIEAYPVVLRVQGCAAGVYHYEPSDHSLTLLRSGFFGRHLARWTLHQPYLADASAIVVWAGVCDRVRPRYGERGYRYMLLEAGHIAQNFSLLCAAYGLGSLCIGGFVDAAVSRLVGLNEITEIPLYLTAVGVPRLR